MTLVRILTLTGLLLSGFGSALAESRTDFNRDIRPILSDNCFSCHGFDASSREADLRLDTREGATVDLGGYAAIVPEKPDESELMKRITSADSDLVMPPADSHRKPLKPAQVKLIRDWIAEGAVWGKHWAFVPPERPAITELKTHPIDALLARELQRRGLKPAQRAEVHTLARRLHFDLTGLPPQWKRVQQLGSDPTEAEWEELIDELLASPQFGERMAMWWLDGARYSDTDGFQQDSTRTNWPWRDWVVNSFNRNKPFDQFTIEQFAGDLLPDATPEQKMATCFHRNHMNNGEGGRDPEESRVDYVLDRVNTTGTLWLGLTLGCTQCHDHKFDPISQRDYYSLSAYFNSIDETGAAGGKAAPYLKVRSPSVSRQIKVAELEFADSNAELSVVRQQAEREFEPWLASRINEVRNGFQPWTVLNAKRLLTSEGYTLKQTDDGTIIGSNTDLPQDDYIVTLDQVSLDRITALRLEVFPHPDHTEGKYSFAESGEFILTNIRLLVRQNGSSQIRELEFARAVADVEGTGVDSGYKSVRDTLDDDPRKGWTTRTKPSDVPHVAIFELKEPLELSDDEQIDIYLMQRSLAPRELMGRFRLSATDQRGNAVRKIGRMPMEELADVLANDVVSTPAISASIPASLRKSLLDQFLEDHALWQANRRRNDRFRSQLSSVKKAAGDVNVMILKEREKPRTTHILERGVWDQKGDEVTRSVLPVVLEAKPEESRDRLALGRWIVDRRNPLTARVICNQVWQLFFGAGLVRTPSDFGQQGELPTHPDLLDWLAVEFMESGWDIKHLVKLIVTSETYRQSSNISHELMELDPENRLLARGARYRLPSWMIRDASLRTSGLLDLTQGGPPVFPYQPPGIWRDQFMGRFTYTPSVGASQNRRTLYAFWRRSSAPTFLFDAAMRRTCEVVPRRTNTPLHALTLLNNTTSLESARALADQAVQSAEDSPSERIAFLFRSALSRNPLEAEVETLAAKLKTAISYYRKNPDQAARLVQVGQLGPPETSTLPEVAGTMLIANLILNLDESMTHE